MVEQELQALPGDLENKIHEFRYEVTHIRQNGDDPQVDPFIRTWCHLNQ